jgi:hypothetical protein
MVDGVAAAACCWRKTARAFSRASSLAGGNELLKVEPLAGAAFAAVVSAAGAVVFDFSFGSAL